MIVIVRNILSVLLSIFLLIVGFTIWATWVYLPNDFWTKLAALLIGSAVFGLAYLPVRLIFIRKITSDSSISPNLTVVLDAENDAIHYKGDTEISGDEFVQTVKRRSIRRVILDLSVIFVFGFIAPALTGSAVGLTEEWEGLFPSLKLVSFVILFLGIFLAMWFDVRSSVWWVRMGKSIIKYDVAGGAKGAIPFQNIGAGIKRLSECEIIVEVKERTGVTDWKRNAGISALVGFNNVRGRLTNDFLDAGITSLNADLPAIKVWRQSWFTSPPNVGALCLVSVTLSLLLFSGIEFIIPCCIVLLLLTISYFLLRGSYWIFAPNGMLINKSGPLEIYPYSTLNASTEFVRFVWTGMAVSAKDPLRDEKDLPEDAFVIGQTWRYVNLDGGPDRRFNDNFEMPVILAGVLTLDVPDRNSLSLQTTNWYLPLEFSDYWARPSGTDSTKDPIDTLKPVFQRIFPPDFLTDERSKKPVKDLGNLARAELEKVLKIAKKPSTAFQSVTTKNTSQSKVSNASTTITRDQPMQTEQDALEPLVFGGTTSSVVKQINNFTWESEQQFAVIAKQLSQLLEQMDVGTEISSHQIVPELTSEMRDIAAAAENRLEEARSKFGAAFGDPEIYLRLGNLWFDAGKFERAVDNYGQIIELNPQCSIAFNYRGQAYAALGMYKQAVEDHDEAIRLDPGYAEAYNNKGLIYHFLGQHEQAIQDYDEAIRLDPQLAIAYSNRGLSYDSQGHYERSIQDCDQAIRLDPNQAVAYNNRGLSYLNLGRHERAIEDCDQAIRLDPQFSRAHNNRGLAYNNLGQYQRAVEDCDQAIRLDPNDGYPYYNRAIAYHNLGQKKRSKEDFKEAVRLNPELPRSGILHSKGFWIAFSLVLGLSLLFGIVPILLK